MKSDWKKGDDVWIFMPHHKGEKSKGTILEILDLSEHGYSWPYYLIEVQTSIDPLLEVREAFTMAESEDGPIGIWSKMRKEFTKEKLNEE